MLRFTLYFFILIGLSGPERSSAGVRVVDQKPGKNCFITTTSEHKDGDVKSNINSFYFKTKIECEKMMTTLSDNFAPREIKKVTAKFEWRGQ